MSSTNHGGFEILNHLKTKTKGKDEDAALEETRQLQKQAANAIGYGCPDCASGNCEWHSISNDAFFTS